MRVKAVATTVGSKTVLAAPYNVLITGSTKGMHKQQTRMSRPLLACTTTVLHSRPECHRRSVLQSREQWCLLGCATIAQLGTSDPLSRIVPQRQSMRAPAFMLCCMQAGVTGSSTWHVSLHQLV